LREGKEFHASNGTQVRDYLHVDDVAAGFLTLATGRASGDFNICSGEPVQVRTILQLIANELGRPQCLRLGALAPRRWDPAFICGDSGRLRSLGWQPRYTLESGIRDTLRHIQLTDTVSGRP
jgi:nucleoside-diphosphate-sugar epimerase